MIRKTLSLLMVISMLVSMLGSGLFVFATDATDTTQVVEITDGEENGTATGNTGEGEIPNEGFGGDEPEEPVITETGVTSAEELEAALAEGYDKIELLSDITVDRTFVVLKNTVICATEDVTLTRATSFAGDMFLLGPAEKNEDEAAEPVNITFGSSDAKITIDGNKANMTVDVVGTAFFIRNLAKVELNNITVQNAKKVGNETTLDETYGLSYETQIGGAAVILASGELDIYGSEFTDNEVNNNDVENKVSTQGGAIYSFGLLNIYDSHFEGNFAGRAGAIYNYRETHINGTVFKNNTASYRGGVIYVPASTAAFLYIGEEAAVSFEDNTAAEGGAIFTQRTTVVKDTTFTGNKATSGHGGALYVTGAVEDGKTFEAYNSTFTGNQSYYNGGAIYFASKSTSYMEDVTFTQNEALATANDDGKRYGGGAIYGTGATIEIVGGEFTENTSDNMGGAFEIHSSSVAILDNITVTNNTAVGSTGGAFEIQSSASITMNKVTATGNESAEAAGGFMHVKDAEAKVYNSIIKESSGTNGSAIAFYEGSSGGVYNTEFNGNHSSGNGGALFIYTSGEKVTLHTVKFINNIADNFGGAIYISKASVSDMYNITAKGNSALSGGFMYETTTATTVNLNGITVSGNTATNGPIIFGNLKAAVLNINKTNYVDEDVTGDLDDAYWANAIFNKLTVNTIISLIPSYKDFGEEGGEEDDTTTEVIVGAMNAAELESALTLGYNKIQILRSFTVDRTFNVTKNTTIFANEDVTLTRAPSFAGDMFVFVPSETEEEEVVITLGSNDAKITVDGNKDNMEVDVVGTVFFIEKPAKVELRGVKVINAKKTGNERLLEDKYTLSYKTQIGGAAAIIVSGELNIYDSEFTDNEVAVHAKDNDVSGRGGAIYAFGALNVYNSTFKNNHATKAGAIYVYRETHLVDTTIEGSTSSTLGGAIYVPSSTVAFLYTDNATFKGNSAPEGGAVYSAGTVGFKNTSFIENEATTGNGGALSLLGKKTSARTLEGTNVTFTNNTAAKAGGAIYMIPVESEDEEGATIYINGPEAKISGATFTGNKANGGNGGAIWAMNSTEAEAKTLELYNAKFSENEAAYNGGAIYFGSNSISYMEDVDFTKNKALATANNAGTRYGGGAIYGTGITLEINGAKFVENVSDNHAGAIELHTYSTAVLNDITATGNSAVEGSGGFAYVSKSSVKMYNSYIKGNVANVHGGGLYVSSESSLGIHKTDFIENEAKTGRGGAACIYTGGGDATLNEILFKENKSAVYGGAVMVSEKTQLNMYNIEAVGNTSDKGGFMYETLSGTVVKINGLTVQGNTATSGGPIIWGNTTNAKLYINKTNYVDKDATGELDDTYWASAIAYKLTVYDLTDDVPKPEDYGDETTENMDGIVDVRTIDELEAALASDAKNIKLTSNIEVDRTLYVTGEKVLFTTAKKTIKRSSGFAGDMFVVGEDKDGKYPIIEGIQTTFTLGNPESETENLLVIDGNRDNISGDVVGSAIFVAGSATVNIHKNISIVNNCKNGNERGFAEKYALGSPEKIGGAAIVNIDGTIYIHGGLFENNVSVSETLSDGIETGINGGAIHNRGNITIYDGNFRNNEGTLGAVAYNLKRLDILGGKFIENHSLRNGGAIYVASSQYAHLYVGAAEGAGISDKILFKNNTSDSSGAALYNSVMGAVIVYGDVTFDSNYASATGGAIATYGTLNVSNAAFVSNGAKTRGGAVYLSNSNDVYTTRIVNLTNCSFDGNVSTSGGAVAVFASSMDLSEGGIVEIENCNFIRNKACDQSGQGKTGNSYGGAIYNSRKGSVTVTGSTFEENEAGYEGGVLYSAGESVTTITDSTMTNNRAVEEAARGGAVSVHSATLNFDGVTFEGNASPTNGGALYISYTTSSEINSVVNVSNSFFNNNAAGSNGAAIYATEHEVPEDKRVLTVKNTEFNNNEAVANGGAVYLTSKVDSYMKDVDFTGNKVLSQEKKTYGGAVYMASGSSLELDTATFTGNESSYCAGGIAVNSSSVLTLHNVTADGNTSVGSAGFLYGNNARIIIFDSTIKNSSAGVNGGAMAFYNATTVAAYGVTLEGNRAESIGGAVYSYQNLTEVLFHSSVFKNNEAGTNGGVIYLSNEGVLNIYNTEAIGNKADKGGFLYETTTGSEATLRGLVVEGNSATTDGDIIFGNSYGATLYIDKINYEDRLNSSTGDDAYWDYAIKNMLTVVDVSGTDEEIPERLYYVAKEDSEEEEGERPVVPVDDVLSLGISSSEVAFNSTYGKLPKLDNSSNFMSDNVTVFENINGEDVTVDTFVYHPNNAEGNVNFGLGMLIYQAILYKEAHPEEDVKVSIAHFRFEMETALCINRDSRYFGYMRNLVGMDYDKYGFVRISYLLVTAAKMGIDVTVMGQIPGYPHSAYDPDFIGYFEDRVKDPCDPVYVGEGKKVGDYMKFVPCEWTSYEDKAGSDMMHLKMATASHYLDMNGVAHKNALFTSTANLDGINTNATNGNNKVQAGVIVSDHEALYRTANNYINLIAENRGQEEVYIFRTILAERTAEQFELILAGRENEIPADKQIVYLGTESDDVFELYFTPFGGEPNSWTEKYNPYCKYIKKLADSEDYILLTWNNANYIKSGLVEKLEGMISEAYHSNKNPDNKIYVNLAEFDSSAFDDLEVGADIGLKSFNEKEFGALHTKDLQVSYVENGERKYVTLFNTLNMHSGAIGYQSNSVLIVKENSAGEGSVFFALADNTTNGIVEHTYGEEKTYIPETNEDGQIYKECEYCDKKIVLETVHRPSDWIVAKEATAQKNGISYKKCIGCGKLLEAKENVGKDIEIEKSEGKYFTADELIPVEVNSVPYTFEAVVNVPVNISGRAGVIVGSYTDAKSDALSFEIHEKGRPRLYYKIGNKIENCIFSYDIRSNKQEYVAIAVEWPNATLYVNGEAVETKTLSMPMPETVEDLKLGGDNRQRNTQYFKGSIYSVALFGDLRTAEEIKADAISMDSGEESLLYMYDPDKSNDSTEKTNSYVSVGSEGGTFTSAKYHSIETLTSTPHTFELTVHIPKEMEDRAGSLIGNYYDPTTENQLVLEMYDKGEPRLMFRKDGVSRYCLFSTDVRSDGFKHIAITVEDTVAKLYVDGELAETRSLPTSLPVAVSDFKIGGDNRAGNERYFRGEIKSVALFSDARTAEEIKQDAIFVTEDSDGLLYSSRFHQETGEFVSINGRKFSETEVRGVNVSETPYTIEAILNVPETLEGRGGVIVGNYEVDSANIVNFEVYNEGKLRLYWRNKLRINSYVFDTDIRSGKQEYVALTVDGNLATLYVNGEVVETAVLPDLLPANAKNFKVGGDNRAGNTQYFKGTIYNVAMYNDVRTAEEIRGGIDEQDENLIYNESFATVERETSTGKVSGRTFYPTVNSRIPLDVDELPLTFEATVNVPKDIDDRAGVIVGNYAITRTSSISFEIFTQGRVRLYHKTGGITESCVFDTDIRSDKMVHVAVAVDGKEVTLYINGEYAETKTMANFMPDAFDKLNVGGDNRTGNIQYFKGTIGSVALFSDVRTAEEIAADAVSLSSGDENLLCSMSFVEGVCPASLIGEGHVESDWLVIREPSGSLPGLKHKKCTLCDTVIIANEYIDERSEGESVDYVSPGSGLTISSADDAYSIDKTFAVAPKTFEASFVLKKSYSERAGVLVGNYDNTTAEQINVEIYTNGKPRLYYKTNYRAYTYLFTTDVRSDTGTHLAITIDGLTATLYLNGVAKETVTLGAEFANACSNYKVGSDNRTNNPPYFKGTINSVAIFDDARTPEEIQIDMLMVPSDTEGLLFSKYFVE